MIAAGAVAFLVAPLVGRLARLFPPLVTGTVILYKEKPEIKIDDPEQIKIVEKK